MNLELVTIMFDDQGTANDAYKAVRTLQTDGVIDILDAATVVKRRDGTSQIHDTQDVDAPHGRLFGIAAGGLVGLIGGPAGALIGAVAGGATGAMSASLIDVGFLKDDLRALLDRLSPGSSALVVLVEPIWLDQLEATLASYDRTIDQAIPPDAERFFAQRMGATTVEVASSHVAMVSHPNDVVRLIKSAARNVGAGQ